MPRRSPGQSKLKLRPTASDRARRQRSRRMLAENVDSEHLVREKSSNVDALVPGQSGDMNDIGSNTTNTKLTVKDYQEQIQIENFEVSETPKFYASETENEDDVEQTKGLKFSALHNLTDVKLQFFKR